MDERRQSDEMKNVQPAVPNRAGQAVAEGQIRTDRMRADVWADLRDRLGRGQMRTTYVLEQRTAGVLLSELARQLGVTSERVRQIQARGERRKREAAKAKLR